LLVFTPGTVCLPEQEKGYPFPPCFASQVNLSPGAFVLWLSNDKKGDLTAMNKYSGLLLILALVVLLLGVPVSRVSADGAVTLTKVASTDNATLGDNITYTYTIINNSTDNLTGLQLADDKIGTIDIDAELPAGGTITATHTYTVLPGDYADNASALVNIATLTGSENISITATESVALDSYNASLQVYIETKSDAVSLGDIITYTYKVVNSGLVELSDIVLKDDKLVDISLLSENVTVTSLAPGATATGTASYKVVFADLLSGAVKNTATVTGIDPAGNPVSASSGVVTVSTNIIRSLLNKAQTLRSSGVPGKGIDTAPGLQKPFNPNSQAGEHAGKKDGNGNMNMEQNQEMNSSGQDQGVNTNNGKGKGHGKNK
jgi:hypothetical protein